jgi:hypothetical protein
MLAPRLRVSRGIWLTRLWVWRALSLSALQHSSSQGRHLHSQYRPAVCNAA